MLQNNVFKKKQKCYLNDGMNRIRRNCCFSCFSNHLDILRMHRFSRSWLSNINFENYALCFISLSAQCVLWCFHAGLEPAVCFPKKWPLPTLTIRHEFQQWKAAWQELPEHPQVSGKISQAHRPQNSPERRLLGMFHHLHRIANDGLLKRWLVVFRNLSVFSEEKELRRQALVETELLFSTPDRKSVV